ncbi:PREDICTED: cysteine and histidine-rich protein 1 [Buceros rhinoceros silvestris]|uniref:cysteine and histidine-rich protein 1 n=1 Tax=Buceros rhinoceros silvestris TaxID=175836 RepID=UPI0005290B4C|nr:PREDICTED: cysteine and histidine-rich protein 1 [Buceros rhinoceros silvestris]
MEKRWTPPWQLTLGLAFTTSTTLATRCWLFARGAVPSRWLLVQMEEPIGIVAELEISKSLCCRNLAVEKAVSELPSECGFCTQQFPRSLLERHQKEECQDRVTQCKYKRIGCPWQGPYHELTVHEAECTHPTKTGNELMEILDEMDQTRQKEMQLYNSIFSLLSFEKIDLGMASSTGSASPVTIALCRGVLLNPWARGTWLVP